MRKGNTVVEECASTNDLARELAQSGCPDGSWIAARSQTQGRGRQGRVWIGATGNLHLSIVFRGFESASRELAWLPLALGASVAQSLREHFPIEHEDACVSIKWPNDLYARGRKLGGLLCEASSPWVVAGLGLNCRSRPEDGSVLTPAISLSELTGRPISAEDVLADMVTALRAGAELLREGGSSAVRPLYDRLSWLTAGTPVKWTVGEAESAGRVEGLSEYGELIVIGADGHRIKLNSADVHVASG